MKLSHMFNLDTPLFILLVFCITSALVFEFINGFHDTANAVATTIYTHSLKPFIAVIWSALWNFIGVNVGGIAVAIGIINLLPVEALIDNNIYHNLAMIMALILTAIIWNIGTWYLGIPCSSSHTLIGSITGVGFGYVLLPGSRGVMLNLEQVKDAGLSLIISPIIGFALAMLMMFLLRRLVKNKTIFKEPPAKKPPPLWIRSILIFTNTFVSFSHGSNDGQKGVGLVMIILIAILPVRFALDLSRDAVSLKADIDKIDIMLSQVNTGELNRSQARSYYEVDSLVNSLQQTMTDIVSLRQMKEYEMLSTRRNILFFEKKSDSFLTLMSTQSTSWKSEFKQLLKKIRTYTEYAPWWVIFLISISLGLGTMVGWKRIVVTLGEKIGRSKLTYAQGATANLVAATTISASSLLGLPVSTTHVLSSGIAGTMVSGNGIKNLQKKTIAAIGIAWLITLPVTILLAGIMFLLFRLILA
jgi:PiT family inorganic phosphate transporter